MENKSCSSAKAWVYLTAEQREILWVDSLLITYAITDIDHSKMNYFTGMPQLPLSDHSHIVHSLNRSMNLLPSDQKVKLHPLPSRFIWSKDSQAQLHSSRV